MNIESIADFANFSGAQKIVVKQNRMYDNDDYGGDMLKSRFQCKLIIAIRKQVCELTCFIL